MDNEQTFLTELCQLISDNKTDRVPRFDSMDIDEELLYKRCVYHQILPLVYYFREPLALRFPTISFDFFEKARTYAIFNATQIMVYENFLAELNEKLTEFSVEYRLLKGLVPAANLYAESYLRTFGDLDIIVRPEAIVDVHFILTGMNFELSDDLYSVFPEDIIRKYSFARHYIRTNASNIAVDVHLNLSGNLHPFQFDINEFWNNSEYVEINSPRRINHKKYPTFTKEYLAVYLLYHAFKHYYFKLIWMIDIFKMLDSDWIDAEKLQKLLIDFNMQKIWCIFLKISLDLFGRVPKNCTAECLRKYRPKYSKIVNAQSTLRGVLPYSLSYARILLPLIYLPRIHQKIGYLLRQLFPPREVIRDFYGDNCLKLNWRNYFKLRKKAIWELMSL